MRKEEKILFRDMTMNEKRNVVKVWERTQIATMTDHAKEKMERLGITNEDVAKAWKVNHIIEYKVVDEDGKTDVRLLVRGLDIVDRKYEWTQNGREMRKNEKCNVCLVVSLTKNMLITTYTSPSGVNKYKHSNGRIDMAYVQSMNDNLRKNLVALTK